MSTRKNQGLQNSQSNLSIPNVYTKQYTNSVFLEAVTGRAARRVNVLGAIPPQSPSSGPYFPPGGESVTSYLATENDNRLTTENNNNIIL